MRTMLLRIPRPAHRTTRRTTLLLAARARPRRLRSAAMLTSPLQPVLPLSQSPHQTAATGGVPPRCSTPRAAPDRSESPSGAACRSRARAQLPDLPLAPPPPLLQYGV